MIKFKITIHKNFFLILLDNKIIFKQFIINSNKMLTFFYVFSLLKKIGFLNKIK